MLAVVAGELAADVEQQRAPDGGSASQAGQDGLRLGRVEELDQVGGPAPVGQQAAHGHVRHRDRARFGVEQPSAAALGGCGQ